MLIEVVEVPGIVRLKQILGICLYFGLSEEEIVTKQTEIVSRDAGELMMSVMASKGGQHFQNEVLNNEYFRVMKTKH